MEYIFRILGNNLNLKQYRSKSGDFYYRLLIGTNHLLVPVKQTSFYHNNLYLSLHNDKENKTIRLVNNQYTPVSDDEILSYINKNCITYINGNRSNPIIKTILPVGIKSFNKEKDEKIISKWANTVNKISKTYSKDLIAINPINCNYIYPFKYKDFLNGSFIKEYCSNIIMFMLTYDRNYEFISRNNKSFILYNNKGKIYPVFELINEEKFYNECIRKDIQNNAKKPFLKSFSDKGLSKEMISFLLEDELNAKRIKKIYTTIRVEMDKHSKKNLYLIPSLDTSTAINVQQKIRNGLPISEPEKYYYQQSYLNRLEMFLKLYNQNKVFYFSYNNLIIDEDKYDEGFFINSALKSLIDLSFDDFYINNNIVYAIDNNDEDCSYPILEIIDKQQLELQKIEIYNKWINSKIKRSRY